MQGYEWVQGALLGIPATASARRALRGPAIWQSAFEWWRRGRRVALAGCAALSFSFAGTPSRHRRGEFASGHFCRSRSPS